MVYPAGRIGAKSAKVAPLAKIERDTLSDGSRAYAVIVSIDGITIRLAYGTFTEADKATRAINGAAWAENVVGGIE